MSGRKTAMLLLAAIAVTFALALGAAGCGDDGDDKGDTAPKNGVPPQTLIGAERSVERAAVASAERAKDRYLPGRIEMRAVCAPPRPAPLPDTPFQLICHVEGYGSAPERDTPTYMTYEEWLVPVDAEGKAGEATILGQARIRAWRRKDDRLNCTNRKVRPEQCAPAVPGQTTPTVPQGEAIP